MNDGDSTLPAMTGSCSIGSTAGRWILTATLLASAASFIMWSAVAVALPSIQDYFNTNIAGIQWVVNSHLLTLSAFLLIGGSLGDHYGRKRIFIIGMLLFATGAILSGIAWSISVLVGFQALQGIGSALMVPQSLAIINACFRDEERGRAIGIWAGISGGIAALGPWLGGWLVENFGWPTVFWMTLPVIALALGVTALFIPENRDVAAGRLDWLGTSFIFLGLFGIAYGLIGGPIYGWNTLPVLGSLLGGIVAITVFIFIERYNREPIIPLKIFRNPLVSEANAVTILLYFAFNGAIIFSVLNLQQIQGYSPTQAGIGLLPPIVIITFLAAPAGTLADRFGPRVQMIGGPLMVALGIALLMTGGTDASYFKHFLPGLITMGIGMAFVIAPLTKSALSVETRFSGSASGVNNAIARTAGLLAVAVLGALMISTFAPYLKDTIQSSLLTPPEQFQIISQYDRLGGIVIPDSFGESARAVAQTAVRESFIFSFRWTMGMCSVLALAGSIISFFAIHRRA
ncbi:MFS transporter [Chloroflexota bacterium]